MLRKPVFLPLFVCFFLLTGCVHQDTRKSQNNNDVKPSISNTRYLDAKARSTTGSYLAGRFAQHSSDWQAASYFMQQVLLKDDGNTDLLHRTFLLALGNGSFTQSSKLAQQIINTGRETELATVMMISQTIADDNAERAWEYAMSLENSKFNDYVQPVLQAWLLVMLGNEDVALMSLKKHIDAFDNDPLYLLHVALISEYAREYKQAEEFYQKVLQSKDLTIHGALAVASYYERHDQHGKAVVIYQEIVAQIPAYKALSLSDMARLVGKAAKDPKDAISLVMFELSTLLFERRAYDSALIYTRFAQVVSPTSPFIKIMLGDISVAQGNYNEAVARYNSVEKETGMLRFSRLKAAETLEANGQQDDAIALLLSESEQEKTFADTFIQLGDIYRRHEQYTKAVAAYDDALQRIGDVKEEHWFIIYARGMAQERLNNWGLAEKDLLTALALKPENPLILNYLGYSWVEQGVHLERAMTMIKKAVILRPGDGYITDSYGWALFRAGDFAEAVEWLEYSAERVPYDMTINDHLGDAYWRVDRKTEARFQWKRAYNATKDINEQQRLAKKIKFGLSKGKAIAPEREAMLH